MRCHCCKYGTNCRHLPETPEPRRRFLSNLTSLYRKWCRITLRTHTHRYKVGGKTVLKVRNNLGQLSTRLPNTKPYLQTWLLGEFITLCITEVIVRLEGCIQCWYEVEESLCGDCVTQRSLSFITVLSAKLHLGLVRALCRTKLLPVTHVLWTYRC